MLRLAFDRRHAETPPVGLYEVNAFPAPSTATQKVTVLQETPVRPAGSFRSTCVQSLAPPVGFVEVSTSPDELTMTQSSADGQDKATVGAGSRYCGGLMRPTGWSDQLDAPAAGRVDVTVLPSSSTARQKEVVGQEAPITAALHVTVVRLESVQG